MLETEFGLNALLHLDKYMVYVIEAFGVWTYVILFAVVFCETGLVVAPFLPGDSLLFVAGTLAGSKYLKIELIYGLLMAAAIVGDTVNYWLGHYLGEKVFSQKNSKIFKLEYLEKTREFYEKYGGKTIILARFLPILRTFAPFVAGVGKMHYRTFFIYNVTGGVLWVSIFMFAGYFFGRIKLIQENFHWTAGGIILVSLLPMAYEYGKYRRGIHLSKAKMKHATYSELVEAVKEEKRPG